MQQLVHANRRRQLSAAAGGLVHKERQARDRRGAPVDACPDRADLKRLVAVCRDQIGANRRARSADLETSTAGKPT